MLAERLGAHRIEAGDARLVQPLRRLVEQGLRLRPRRLGVAGALLGLRAPVTVFAELPLALGEVREEGFEPGRQRLEKIGSAFQVLLFLSQVGDLRGDRLPVDLPEIAVLVELGERSQSGADLFECVRARNR